MSHEKIELPQNSKLLDKNYQGPVYIWDIDKTYLATRFESIRGLIKTAFEKAHEKNIIAGTAVLLQELHRGSTSQNQKNPIFFISASPPQMRKVIEQKMRLDQIEFDGIIFKDNLKNIYKGKFKKIKEQIGYKLIELLTLRSSFPPSCQEFLFGDDFENDAIIYSLYSDICDQRLQNPEIQKILMALGVAIEDIKIIFSLKRKIKKYDPVQKIYIHLEKKTNPAYFDKFWPKFIPTYNSFQAALRLYQENHISQKAVIRIAQDLIRSFKFTPKKITHWLYDAYERDIVDEEVAIKLIKPLQNYNCIDKKFNTRKLKWQWIKFKKRNFKKQKPTTNLVQNHFLKYLDDILFK